MEVTAGANYDAPVLGEGVHNADVILALLTQNKELEGIFFCWFCERKNGRNFVCFLMLRKTKDSKYSQFIDTNQNLYAFIYHLLLKLKQNMYV